MPGTFFRLFSYSGEQCENPASSSTSREATASPISTICSLSSCATNRTASRTQPRLYESALCAKGLPDIPFHASPLMNDRYPYRSRSIETSVLHRAFGPQIFGDALHEAGLAAAADAADDLDHPVVMVKAANLLQVVFSGEQTHTGSNLHWSQSFELRVYWDIHYRLSDLYPPITKIILFTLNLEIVNPRAS